MTALAIIERIRHLPPEERTKVEAFVRVGDVDLGDKSGHARDAQERKSVLRDLIERLPDHPGPRVDPSRQRIYE